jgi:hypothetical protein
MFGDPDPDVRWEALHWAPGVKKSWRGKQIVSKELIGLIIKILLEDPDPDNRVEAAETLGYCEDAPEVIAALSWAREHDFEISDLGHCVSDSANDALKRISASQG